MSQATKALVMRLFDEVFTARNLDAADDIMAGRYVEHAVEPFGRGEPGPVSGPSHAREVVAWLRARPTAANDRRLAVLRAMSQTTELPRLRYQRQSRIAGR